MGKELITKPVIAVEVAIRIFIESDNQISAAMVVVAWFCHGSVIHGLRAGSDGS